MSTSVHAHKSSGSSQFYDRSHHFIRTFLIISRSNFQRSLEVFSFSAAPSFVWTVSLPPLFPRCRRRCPEQTKTPSSCRCTREPRQQSVPEKNYIKCFAYPNFNFLCMPVQCPCQALVAGSLLMALLPAWRSAKLQRLMRSRNSIFSFSYLARGSHLHVEEYTKIAFQYNTGDRQYV
jgi:hypothetical protein